jgi:transcriptional regulator with XRE-family HTH domain
MKEINIASILIQKRKEKGITQEDLANYIGVSKAAISKWENAQSYPDITLLPLLAAYFNISIDDLIGYSPQLVKEDIQRLYQNLCRDFSTEPFDTVIEKCRDIIKKYYSCFPLLFQMGILYINHSMICEDAIKTNEINEEARQIFHRITEEDNDINLIKQAQIMEGYCYLILNKPEKALEELGEIEQSYMSKDVLLATAYQMTGNEKKAITALQVNIYQNIMNVIGTFPSLFSLYAGQKEKFEDSLERFFMIEKAFDVRNMHPGVVLPIYLSAAQIYLMLDESEKALAMLEQYVDIVVSDIFPLRLKGSDFFDSIDDWLLGLDLGVFPPRNDKTIKQSMISAVTKHPLFQKLDSDVRYKNLIQRLNSLNKE